MTGTSLGSVFLEGILVVRLLARGEVGCGGGGINISGSGARGVVSMFFSRFLGQRFLIFSLSDEKKCVGMCILGSDSFLNSSGRALICAIKWNSVSRMSDRRRNVEKTRPVPTLLRRRCRLN